MKRTSLIALSLWASVVVGSAWPSDDDVRDINTLIQDLSSNDFELQRAALDTLEVSPESALPSVPALVEVVRKSNAENRISALDILAELGPLAKDAAPPIGAALKDPSVAVRMAAADALLHISSQSDAAIAVLADALRDGDQENRLAAARRIRYAARAATGAAPALAGAAADKDAAVRAEVASALGAIAPVPNGRSLAALKNLVADESPLVRVRAARSLWEFDEPAETLVPVLTKIVVDFEPAANRKPMDEFFFGDEVPARVAIELLGEIGPEAKSAIPALLAAVDNPRLAIRLPAVDALGAIGPEAGSAIERLERALRDTEVHSYPFAHRAYCLSNQAGIALRQIGPASTSVLLAALDDRDERVRANAADALGYLPDSKEQVIPALVRLLDDRNESVRAIAAFALGRIGPAAAAAAPALAAHLNDAGKWTSYPGGGIGSTFTVGDHILAALESIAPEPKSVVPAITQELKQSGKMADAMREMLRHLGPDAEGAITVIEPLLDDPDNGLAAALALARIAPNRDGLLEKLHTALVDPDKYRALDPARGLGDLGSKARAVLPDLYAQLDREREPSAKAILAAAIVKIDRRQQRAVIELAMGLQQTQKSLGFSGHDEAAATWSTLGEDAKPAIERLIAGLSYESPDRPRDYFWAPRDEAQVRLRSAELLIDVAAPSPEVIDALVDLCRSACGHRGMAADALGRIGPAAGPAVPALVRLLADREMYIVGGDFHGNGGKRFEPGVRAALALGKIGAPAVQALRAALKDDRPIVRQHAAGALGSIGEAARPAAADLIAAVEDHHRSVRAAAAEALGRIRDTDEATIAALVHAVADKHLVVRAATATALGNLGPAARAAVFELSKLADEPFEMTRSAAVAALRKICTE